MLCKCNKCGEYVSRKELLPYDEGCILCRPEAFQKEKDEEFVPVTASEGA
jgi:hypothetical protein